MFLVWTIKQYGTVIDEFRSKCDDGTWKAILLAFSVLREKGNLCGPLVAKKLTNGDGFWELRAGHKTSEPRLLFYFSKDVRGLMIFVHAFLKKSPNDYGPALALAKKRRTLVKEQRAIPHDVKSTHVH